MELVSGFSESAVHARQGAGMDLRGPLIGMYAYPTLVIFCEGQGIAAARALAQAGASEGGLSFQNREDVRMYYRVGRCPSRTPHLPPSAGLWRSLCHAALPLLRAVSLSRLTAATRVHSAIASCT